VSFQKVVPFSGPKTRSSFWIKHQKFVQQVLKKTSKAESGKIFLKNLKKQ